MLSPPTPAPLSAPATRPPVSPAKGGAGLEPAARTPRGRHARGQAACVRGAALPSGCAQVWSRDSRRWFRGAARWPLAVAIIGLSAGCLSPPSFPREDLSEVGWHTRQGQAIWRPGRRAVELAGDLVLATHPDGRCVLQFSKDPISLVSAQATTNAWRIEFGSGQRRFAGRGKPPGWLVWFQLARIHTAHSQPSACWAETRDAGWLRLENRGTGEVLEGFLSP